MSKYLKTYFFYSWAKAIRMNKALRVKMRKKNKYKNRQTKNQSGITISKGESWVFLLFSFWALVVTIKREIKENKTKQNKKLGQAIIRSWVEVLALSWNPSRPISLLKNLKIWLYTNCEKHVSIGGLNWWNWKYRNFLRWQAIAHTV
jgi:hypothetical protein